MTGERWDLMGHQRPRRTTKRCNPKVDCTLRLLQRMTGDRYGLMGHQRPRQAGKRCNPKADCTLRLLGVREAIEGGVEKRATIDGCKLSEACAFTAGLHDNMFDSHKSPRMRPLRQFAFVQLGGN